MIKKAKIRTVSIFSAIFVAINVVYFIIYGLFLYGKFSFLSVFYIALVSFSFSIVINLIRHKAWQIFCYIFLGVFYFWSLINFVYFKVFGTFLDLGISYMSSFKGSFLGFGKDFYHVIPLPIFLLAIVFFISNIWLFIIFFKYAQDEHYYSDFRLNKLSEKRVSKLSYIFVLSIGLLLINSIGFAATGYFEKHPNDSWWRVQSEQQDIGLIGHVYNQLFNSLRGDETAFAKTPHQYGSENNMSLLEDIKSYYIEGSLNSNNNSNIQLPHFSKKPNVIIIQLESVGQWAIDNNPTPMPFLHNLMDQNITAKDFYPNSCETVNAEFSSLCSFWPNSEEPISFSHKENNYRCLPTVLNEKYKYSTHFFHSNLPTFWDRDVLVPKWGFRNTYFTPYFRQKEDDEFVFTKAVDVLSEYDESNPFFAYILSFTTHSPHNDELIEYNLEKNNLKINEFEGPINSEYSNIEIDEDTLRKYYGFLTATDNALQKFFEKMEQKDLLKDTIVVIYNDHRYYNFNGDSLDDFYKYNRIPFVMVLPEHQKGEITDLGSHIDIAPTVLNMVEGDDYQQQQNFMGTSMFSKKQDKQVLNKCLGNIFYINKDVLIQGSVKSDVYSQSYLGTSDKTSDKIPFVKSLVKKSDYIIYNDFLVGDNQ